MRWIIYFAGLSDRMNYYSWLYSLATTSRIVKHNVVPSVAAYRICGSPTVLRFSPCWPLYSKRLYLLPFTGLARFDGISKTPRRWIAIDIDRVLVLLQCQMSSIANVNEERYISVGINTEQRAFYQQLKSKVDERESLASWFLAFDSWRLDLGKWWIFEKIFISLLRVTNLIEIRDNGLNTHSWLERENENILLQKYFRKNMHVVNKDIVFRILFKYKWKIQLELFRNLKKDEELCRSLLSTLDESACVVTHRR